MVQGNDSVTNEALSINCLNNFPVGICNKVYEKTKVLKRAK